MRLTVIIPARNEVYLERTIRDILKNVRGDTDIIAVLDGYLPTPEINIGDSRVQFVHYPKSIGQRQAINAAARITKADYIMKLDAHCALDEGFDVKLMSECAYEWTVIPRMYNLDHETWLPKRHKRTDYMYIGGPGEPDKYFRALYYDHRLPGQEHKIRQPKKPDMIDDTMCCMGPCFFMNRQRFWELGGCDEAHGGWGQQGIEVALKAWLSGGALKVNKNTWFAHWFRGGGGPGFPYKISGKDVANARKYSKHLWTENRWPLAERKFKWVIEKFNPPGWN